MNNLSTYIVEKLHLNKETKVKDPEQLTTKYKLHENQIVDTILYCSEIPNDDLNIVSVIEKWVKTYNIEDIKIFGDNKKYKFNISINYLDDDYLNELFTHYSKKYIKKDLYTSSNINIYSFANKIADGLIYYTLVIKTKNKGYIFIKDK